MKENIEQKSGQEIKEPFEFKEFFIENLHLEGYFPEKEKYKESALFVHGSGFNARSGVPIGEFFASPDLGMKCFTVDLRGHGKSYLDDKEFARVSINDYVTDTEKIAVWLKNQYSNDFKDLVIIGHSSGGIIAQEFARRHGARALVLLASSLPRELAGQEDYPISESLIEDTSKKLKDAYEKEEIKIRSKAELENFFGQRKPVDFDQNFETRYRPMLDRESWYFQYQLLKDLPSIPAGSIKCPIFIQGGKFDLSIPPKWKRRLAGHLQAEYHEYETHHLSMFDNNWPQLAGDISKWLHSR